MLSLQDLLGRLKGVSEVAGGQYMARCPAHNDQKASLALRMGEKGIVMKCMAGCDTEAVVRALGLKMSDLFAKEAKGARAESGKTFGSGKAGGRDDDRARQDEKKAGGQREDGAGDGKRKIPAERLKAGGSYIRRIKNEESGKQEQARETITAVYLYEDAEGRPLLEVGRTKEKSFPVIHFDGKGWYWGDGGRNAILYRLPRMLSGIASGKRIWLVEGEKDADRLNSLGLYASCNKGGAGKWAQESNACFKGARVVIIPDLDEPGKKHARLVSKALEGTAKEVRVLNLRKIDRGLPEHGDVSDLCERLGDEGARMALEEAALRSPVISRIVDDSAYSDYFDGIRGYSVQNGCICWFTRDSWSPLCNFTALPIEEVIQDDGSGELSTSFRVIGWAADGKRLPELTLSAETFASMQWPLKKWGLVANVKSGNGVRERLREAIQSAGDRTALRKVSYRHTGWRYIDGKPVYLHGGGGIGCDEAVVELDYGFNRYDLTGVVRGPALEMDADSRMSYCAGLLMRLMHLAGLRVGIPLLSYMFLSPLRHFLMLEGHRPSFIPFLRGRTGSGKSVMASLVLNCFGRDFSYDTAHPASFDDTINGISLKLFTLKDMPLLIDDYHPEENPQRRRAMEDVAQRVSRMIGDGAKRSRMRNDTTGQEDKPARGLCIQTGEELPRVTESGVARMYVIDLGKGDVPLGAPELLELQKAARDGCFSEVMRGYIEWLLPQFESLAGMLDERYTELLREAISRVEGAHARIPPVAAYLILGMEMMLKYLSDRGQFQREDIPAMVEAAWHAVLDNTRKQVLEMAEEKPTKLFCDTLRELMDSEKVTVCDIGKDQGKPMNMIGYRDKQFFYLNPGQTYGAVQRAMAEQGTSFPLGKNMILKLLADEGLIVRDAATGKNVKQLNKQGVRAWVMWMPRTVLSAAQYEQKRMQLGGMDDARD